MENLINAKVVYKDMSDNNKIVYSNNVSGAANSPLNMQYYKQHTPANYQFVGYGHFDRDLKNGDVNVIYVKKANDSTAKGTIMIDYINADNQLVGHKTLTGNVGVPFAAGQCKSSVPNNYEFKKILTGSNINAFKSNSQMMVVEVTKIRRVDVNVKYLFHGQLVGNVKAHAVMGAAFNVDHYLHMIPQGFVFSKFVGSVPKAVNGNINVSIDVAKKQPKHQPVSKNDQSKNQSVKSNDSDKSKVDVVNEDPEKIGTILMKLASSLHDLGLQISKSHKL